MFSIIKEMKRLEERMEDTLVDTFSLDTIVLYSPPSMLPTPLICGNCGGLKNLSDDFMVSSFPSVRSLPDQEIVRIEYREALTPITPYALTPVFEFPKIKPYEPPIPRIEEFGIPDALEQFRSLHYKHPEPMFETPRYTQHRIQEPVFEMPSFELPKPTFEFHEIKPFEFKLPEIPVYEPPRIPEIKPFEIPTFEFPEIKPFEFKLPEIPIYEPSRIPKIKPFDFSKPAFEIKPYEAPEVTFPSFGNIDINLTEIRKKTPELQAYSILERYDFSGHKSGKVGPHLSYDFLKNDNDKDPFKIPFGEKKHSLGLEEFGIGKNIIDDWKRRN